MKKLLLGFILSSILLCSTIHLTAQELFPVIQSIDTIHFHYSIQNNIPTLSNISLPSKGKFPDIKTIELNESDLLLHFNFDRKATKYSPEVLSIQGIKDWNGNITKPEPVKLNPSDNNLTGKTGVRSWQDVTEDVLDINHDYGLIISRSVMENVDCSGEKPSFKTRDQWPHYAVAGIGIVALIIGQGYEKESDNLYAQYQSAWIGGLSESLAKNNYVQADKYYHKYKTWTTTGIIILSADALVYTYRWLNIKHKQKLYNEFCSPIEDVGLSTRTLPNGSIVPTMDLTARF